MLTGIGRFAAMDSGSRSAGVTLIELMVSIALLGVLLAIGVPSFQSFIESSRIRSATSALEGALKLARGEAVKRNSEVLVCRRVSDTNCQDGTTWAAGVLIFDTESAQILKIVPPFSKGVAFQQAPASGVTFEGSGMADSAVSFRLTLDGSCETVISVSNTGSVSEDNCP